jgi:hypothetical protein
MTTPDVAMRTTSPTGVVGTCFNPRRGGPTPLLRVNVTTLSSTVITAADAVETTDRVAARYASMFAAPA